MWHVTCMCGCVYLSAERPFFVHGCLPPGSTRLSDTEKRNRIGKEQILCDGSMDGLLHCHGNGVIKV